MVIFSVSPALGRGSTALVEGFMESIWNLFGIQLEHICGIGVAVTRIPEGSEVQRKATRPGQDVPAEPLLNGVSKEGRANLQAQRFPSRVNLESNWPRGPLGQ
jgi:hypothetical protein